MSEPDADRVSRRGVLAAVGAAGVAALAGCGGGSGGTTPGGDADGSGGTTTGVTTATVPTTTRAEGATTAAGTTTDGGGVTTAGDGLLPAPTLGDPTAPVTMQVFEDYACPHCREYSLNVFPKVRSQYVEAGIVHYEFHDLPIPVSNASVRAANAARAVQHTVGNAAFWAYNHALFENQESLGPSTYADLAEAVGADPERVRSAALEGRYRATIEADRQRGIEMGAQGTPAVFVDGGSPLDRYGFETISDAIERARSTA